MAVNGRQKGQRGEREAAEWLASHLGLEVKRHLGQARDGGADILDLDGLVIEVKRCETLALNRWWNQVERAADREGKLPVLMYRRNREKWTFCIPAYCMHPAIKGRVALGENEFRQWLDVWFKNTS